MSLENHARQGAAVIAERGGSIDVTEEGEGASDPAGSWTAATAKRTAQAPGRPTSVHEQRPELRGPGDHSPTRRVYAEARAAG